MCKELKPIYQAVDADAAERALERFRNTTMGKKYPAIIQIWERAWAQVIPFMRRLDTVSFRHKSSSADGMLPVLSARIIRSIRSIRLKGSTELSGR